MSACSGDCSHILDLGHEAYDPTRFSQQCPKVPIVLTLEKRLSRTDGIRAVRDDDVVVAPMLPDEGSAILDEKVNTRVGVAHRALR